METNCNNFISDILEQKFTASSLLTKFFKTKGLSNGFFIRLYNFTFKPFGFFFNNCCNNY
ncbi:MAG: hypothetical protein CMP76_07920 [Flavobacterium sp.]|nr:hypothetical protein [Flavobacterium sp.]